jgi:hypothetical protein
MGIASKVVSAIHKGSFDDSLEQIAVAVSDRRRALVQIEAADIVVGDTVVFNHRARPQYLRGITAEVIGPGRKANTFLVRLNSGSRRYYTGSEVTAPYSIVSKA